MNELPIYMEYQFLKNGKSSGKFYENNNTSKFEMIIEKIVSTTSFEPKYSYRCKWCPVKNFCS